MLPGAIPRSQKFMALSCPKIPSSAQGQKWGNPDLSSPLGTTPGSLSRYLLPFTPQLIPPPCLDPVGFCCRVFATVSWSQLGDLYPFLRFGTSADGDGVFRRVGLADTHS